MKDTKFEDLKGKILINIEQIEDRALIFHCKNGIKYKMYHWQSCCEDVTLEDINGDLNDLIDSEILVAEERINSDESEFGSQTWTFYTIRTLKGSVDIRWYGKSNGCYSETVNFEIID